MHRTGYTKVPNHVWDDDRLDGVDIALLTWLNSHVPSYIVKGPIVRDRLRMAEPKYNKRMRNLVNLGFLKKSTAYFDGKVAGIHVQVTWLKLSKQNMGSESDAEHAKAVRRNDGLLRRTITKKGASPAKVSSSGEVIDHQDEM